MTKLLLLVPVLGACVASAGVDDAVVSNVPRLSANGLTPEKILSATALRSTTLTSRTAEALGADDPALDVLHYAVECALGTTQSFSYDMDGVHHVVSGAMGLAPGWMSSDMSATEAAWVSACVYSRANESGTSIAISDRGTAAGLATTSAELAGYQLEEGAFWGNLFVDLGDVEGYSCNGVDQAADDTRGDLPLRACAQWDGITGSNASPCGMHYAGLCSDACATASPYSGCGFLGGTPSSAVITTFLYGTP